MAESTSKLKLPAIASITLRDFSLYSAQPTITAEFERGVFCLAGANGLGKSTFLAALNFALTGIVPNPARDFKSVSEYYKNNLDFSKDYFSGRIDELNRDTAEVSVVMTVGDRRYEFTRGMFEPEELRSLTIERLETDDPDDIEGEDLDGTERHAQFAASLASDIGLDSFQQFVFLQHFVFTFDEQRHLLFWDEKVLQQVLYLAFGVDYEEAARADTLRRDSEKADSLARNYNWQATEVRKKTEDLAKALAIGESAASEEDADLVSEHKVLANIADSMNAKLRHVEEKLSDVRLQLAELTSSQATLRNEFEIEFAKRIEGQLEVEASPLVSSSVSHGECGLCGTKADHVASYIQEKLSKQQCPLCDSSIGKAATLPDFKRLQKIDAALAETKTGLASAIAVQERLIVERSEAEKNLSVAGANLSSFEIKNNKMLAAILSSNSDDSRAIRLTMQRYQSQIDELLAKKDDQYTKRNEKRRLLLTLQKKLVKRYQAAEENFVPAFTELAMSFLGLDLSIQLVPVNPVGISILLEVKSTARRYFHQLSESQRFFVDIALRMALIRYMSADAAKGTLFVDTPEGSLDIAYENRAGDMFARFAKMGFGLVMTANINTSRLLIALAEQCGRKEMRLLRMTAWTELSDVQIQEEKLFNKAYAEIEKALDTRGKSKSKGLAIHA